MKLKTAFLKLITYKFIYTYYTIPKLKPTCLKLIDFLNIRIGQIEAVDPVLIPHNDPIDEVGVESTAAWCRLIRFVVLADFDGELGQVLLAPLRLSELMK